MATLNWKQRHIEFEQEAFASHGGKYRIRECGSDRFHISYRPSGQQRWMERGAMPTEKEARALAQEYDDGGGSLWEWERSDGETAR